MMRGKGEGEEEIGRMKRRIVQECLPPNCVCDTMKLITSCVIHTGIVLKMRMNVDVHVNFKQGVVVSDEGEEEREERREEW